MKKFLKSEVCGSREQYTGPTCVIEKWLKSQIVRLKKKKKKWKRKCPTWMRSQTHTKGKLQLTHTWFDWNLSYLPKIWNLTLYPPKFWLKFKLSICSLKSHGASVVYLSFNWNLSCLPVVWNLMAQVFCRILFYFIWSCIFMYFVFLEEMDIKIE